MEAGMRHLVLTATLSAALGIGALAQGTATKALPLDNLGLEHLDIVVPDPAASARFYSRIGRSATSRSGPRASVSRRSVTTAFWLPSTTGRAWRRRCKGPVSVSPPP